MNSRQAVVIRLLREETRRDLYEGSDGGKYGCGKYWVTYSGLEQYDPLTREDVGEMLNAGLICKKWKDCDGVFIMTPNA
jgi:hypothetical protein